MTFEINRTELVWPGKYDDEGNLNVSPRVNLPFQVVERVNETRATKESRKSKVATLFDVWEGADEGESFDDGWRNKLIWGDNKLVMESLVEQYAGKIDLIYIDPPFAVGSDFNLEIQVGDERVDKDASMLEEVAYRDTWGKGTETYVKMIWERLSIMRTLLSQDSFLAVHVDWRQSGNVRVLLDEVMGAESFVNQITWQKTSSVKAQSAAFPNVSDIIFIYKKGNPKFNKVFVKSEKDPKTYSLVEEETGRRYGSFDFTQSGSGPARNFGDRGLLDPPAGKHWIWSQDRIDEGLKDNKIIFSSNGLPRVKRYLDEKEGNVVGDIWNDEGVIPLAANAQERTGYPTQKSEALLQRVVTALSNEGGLVADFFCGSGTTLAVAEKLGRRWLGSDLGRFSIHTTRKRLLDINDCKSFEILNLGNYERQFWSSVEFGDDLDGDGRIDLLEYISFILKLYGASPLTGSQFLHGKFERAFVHVGSVSSPITISEVEDALGECVGMSGKELHILGWEWEMGLIDTLTEYAKSKGVKLVARQIPREVMEAEAARKEQVSFYELAYLDASFKEDKNPLSRSCELTDFMIPNPELIPDEVREKITKFSDYVDYWAVDWDFQNDTFMPGWMDYRTKQDRSLALQTDPHTFAVPGTYKVMIKVVDIFGNDTSKVVEVKVS
jgi:adenine-specific DNA-methyltransferase